jgi:hypothetical protein
MNYYIIDSDTINVGSLSYSVIVLSPFFCASIDYYANCYYSGEISAIASGDVKKGCNNAYSAEILISGSNSNNFESRSHNYGF